MISKSENQSYKIKECHVKDCSSCKFTINGYCKFGLDKEEFSSSEKVILKYLLNWGEKSTKALSYSIRKSEESTRMILKEMERKNLILKYRRTKLNQKNSHPRYFWKIKDPEKIKRNI